MGSTAPVKIDKNNLGIGSGSMQNQEQSNETQKPNGLLGLLKGKNDNPLGGGKPGAPLLNLKGGGIDL